MVKNPPAMHESQETWVQSLGREDPLDEGMATHPSILTWESHRQSLADYTVHRVAKSWTWPRWLSTQAQVYICPPWSPNSSHPPQSPTHRISYPFHPVHMSLLYVCILLFFYKPCGINIFPIFDSRGKEMWSRVKCILLIPLFSQWSGISVIH